MTTTTAPLMSAAIFQSIEREDADRTDAYSPIKVGAPITGTTSMVEAVYGGEWTRFVLRIWDAEGAMVFMSSYIESSYVLEN